MSKEFVLNESVEGGGQMTDVVDVEELGDEVTDAADVADDGREVSEETDIASSDETDIQENVLSHDIRTVNVFVAGEEVRNVGEEVRILTKEERLTLTKFKSLINKSETINIASLKTLDKTKIKEKGKQINRVPLVGSYLVVEGLGKVRQQSQNKLKKKSKPCWQRIGERNIVEWRNDLGRVEEVREETDLKREVIARLKNKYEIVGKVYLAVTALLKKKIKH